MSSEAEQILEAAERACGRIAPTWPLDRFIAVNPFWPRTDKPLPRVAGEQTAQAWLDWRYEWTTESAAKPATPPNTLTLPPR